MAKIIRETQKIFGANAPLNQVTSFGSIKSGSPVYTSDIGDLQTSAFETGWSAAVEDDYAPYRQDRNAVDKVTTSQIAYQFQEGIAEWDAGTIYYKGGIVKIINGDKFTLYYSLTDENVGNNPASDNVNWGVWTDNTFPYARITNCITEIPQDIKLELVDGTLTLKAGSKVYVPNGANKFDVVTIVSDIIINGFNSATTNKFLVFLNSLNLVGYCFRVADCFSGSSAPTATAGNTMWYDTTNNIIQNSANQGALWGNRWGLPLAIVTASDRVATSIDQVFNGFGYIGSTVFALPGVKGLIPNGRNADGSLRNIESISTRVRTKTIGSTSNVSNASIIASSDFSLEYSIWLGELDKDPDTSVAMFSRYYNRQTNFMRFLGSSREWANQTGLGQFCAASSSTGTITSLIPKLPFRAVDYNDLPTITYWE